MFDSSGHSLQKKWLSRRIKHELYKPNGSQGESNMNSLQNKWQSRRIKHELSTKEMTVKTLDSHVLCREFMFDLS
jgi:hypothetical protein